MKRFSKGVIALNLALGITTFAIGGLLMSSQNAVIATQRFSPDTLHDNPLWIKGKTFYVTTAEKNQYFFDQHLFTGTVVVIIFLVGADLYLFWSRK